MDKVESKVGDLVERARHMSLRQSNETYQFESFHATIDAHLKKIYESISASPETKEDQGFLKSIQHDSCSDIELIANPLASLDAFRAYMKDPASCAQAPPRELDLSAPISDYFVSSSHNTYLTGNQLYSDAAASAYTTVLLKGCRSVEIDVWDGLPESPQSSDGEASSDSSSTTGDEQGESLGAKIKAKLRSRTDAKEKPKQSNSASGLSRHVSTRLSDALHHRSIKAPETTGSEKTTPSQPPARVEPRVLHGHTLTKGTTFREICYAIRDSAFVASDLPVIISFEVHACLEQQQMMVDIIKEVWDGLLVKVPSDVDADKLPTLAELKRKILIKTKSTPLPNTDEKPEEPETPEPATEVDEQPVDGQPQKPAKPSKVLDALAKLAVYTRAYHFSHFDQPEAKVPVHVFSLSEKAAREAHTNYRDALFKHNRSSLMRIYPFAFRVTSSNLDPSFYWRRGAQLVALNWQNLDKGMMLNQGMFSGTQGWELKPSGYRSSEPASDIIVRDKIDLTLEVFAAQDLSLPVGNHSEKWFRPYVNCQLHVEEPESPAATGRDDASSDSEKSSYRRYTKSSSGRNPDFGGQKLFFPTVTGVIEELSFVRFKIKDDEIGRDSLAAWACIRLDRLREGYRLVHLRDPAGENTGGALLVRITKQVS
ncbi:uncharacterized protein N7459_000640 [Penicillium hispanicum]|uniref:uncharacterized protein n=1 Tax=Penicillium hispanicum TaxID=1080232 RepID=UPI00253FD471|nr:uncharacterized protein N7459_000640 [Penicillium hispanicum]KAJ5594432.1 hypothetical protein N7459_000640 [Penicillium hispanicum]